MRRMQEGSAEAVFTVEERIVQTYAPYVLVRCAQYTNGRRQAQQIGAYTLVTACLLAQGLGRLKGLPVVTDCLIRRRYNPPQARSAGISERLNNVAGTFACRDGRLRGKEVILIDDVSTSGATLNACAGALKSAGAAAVRGLVIALEL